MAGEFYQVNGPWSGKLWMAARPRGGDWLEDEIARWNRQGAGAVLSLLTPDEERDLDLENEACHRAKPSYGICPIACRRPRYPVLRNRLRARHRMVRFRASGWAHGGSALPARNRTQRDDIGMRPRSERRRAGYGHRAREFGARPPRSGDRASARMDRPIRFPFDAREVNASPRLPE